MRAMIEAVESFKGYTVRYDASMSKVLDTASKPQLPKSTLHEGAKAVLCKFLRLYRSALQHFT